MAGRGARRGGIAPLMRATARILRQDDGPNIAAVEFSGWDTHANQGLAGGALDRLLGQLADGVMELRTEMGTGWEKTTVVVMTEFGRTARPNGTGGTDHGTAGAGFLIGPTVARSTVRSLTGRGSVTRRFSRGATSSRRSILERRSRRRLQERSTSRPRRPSVYFLDRQPRVVPTI